jgi:hypothetical protein
LACANRNHRIFEKAKEKYFSSLPIPSGTHFTLSLECKRTGFQFCKPDGCEQIQSCASPKNLANKLTAGKEIR